MSENNQDLEKIVNHGLMLANLMDTMKRYQEIDSYRQELEKAGFEPAIFDLSPTELMGIL